MPRLVTLYSLQWGDLSLEDVCIKAKEFGYDGIEIGLPDHLDVQQKNPTYYKKIKTLLKKYDMQLRTISTHLVGQAVCDIIDERHKGILPDYIWGDGDPEGVKSRAADELILTAKAAKELGVDTVVGFTGSPVWHLLYAFPPFPQSVIEDGYKEFARRFTPILNEYQKLGVRFALEVHPTEIAFDTFSARKALEALEYHPAFGFNYDPSHLGYQGVDYVDFIYQFPDRIFHVHMKDVYWSDTPKQVGIFGGHVPFGDPRRFWNFRSVGRGKINFEEIIRALNTIGYQGPLSIEWEDSAMDREQGARESCEFTKRIDFQTSAHAFDAFFSKD
ncbi:MAG: sugar phosphate isomerase/epimerase [Fermentimonas sp.]|nr:sugar phosphate isomerase/epimerase [Dysgonamonadaceae bacterium]MDD4697589.1 sugar phosphate isomerase/epimerase [Fermentimonas sp.]